MKCVTILVGEIIFVKEQPHYSNFISPALLKCQFQIHHDMIPNSQLIFLPSAKSGLGKISIGIISSEAAGGFVNN